MVTYLADYQPYAHRLDFVKPARMGGGQSFFQPDEGLYTLAYNISKCHINELIFSALCRKLTT